MKSFSYNWTLLCFHFILTLGIHNNKKSGTTRLILTIHIEDGDDPHNTVRQCSHLPAT